MKTLNTTKLVRCIPIPDRKNPSKYILKIIYPRELKGKIAFPLDFEPKPNTEYVCEVIEDREKCCKVLLHKCKFEELEYAVFEYDHETKTIRFVKVLRCKCGEIRRVEVDRYVLPEDIYKLMDVNELVKLKQWCEKCTRQLPEDARNRPYIRWLVDTVEERLRKLSVHERLDRIIAFLRTFKTDLEILEKIEETWKKYLEERGLAYCEACGRLANVNVKTFEEEICLEYDYSRTIGKIEMPAEHDYGKSKKVIFVHPCIKKKKVVRRFEYCSECGLQMLTRELGFSEKLLNKVANYITSINASSVLREKFALPEIFLTKAEFAREVLSKIQ